MHDFKRAAAFITLLVAIGGFLLPRALRASPTALSLGNMLSAGVMLGGGFLHLLPEAADNLSRWSTYPLAYLLFSLGLLLPLIIDSGIGILGYQHVPIEDQHDSKRDCMDRDLDADVANSLCCSAPPPTVRGNTEASGRGHSELYQHTQTHGASNHISVSSALLLLAALTFHSVLEGLAQGAATSVHAASVVIVAIVAHKGLGAFALGSVLTEAR